MKKRLSVIFFISISFIMLLGTINASATTITDLKNKFPAGKYWNHPSGGNNPNGVSSTPCSHHIYNYNNCGEYADNCACNSFSNAIQCHGFGLKLAYDYYGGNPRNWSMVYNLNNLKAGDIVRFHNGSYDHTIWVTNVNGSTVTYADCNSDSRCKIRWDQTTTKSHLSSRLIYVLSAPKEAIDYDSTRSRWKVTVPEGINIRSAAGTGYSKIGAIPYNAYFYITERLQSGQYTWGKVDNYGGVTGWCVLDYAQHVSGPVPELKSSVLPPIHQDTTAHVRDGYFTFKNAASGTFLNVYGGSDKDGTEVTTWSYDDSIDQRFNVVHKGGGKYKLYAECSNNGSNRVVDVRRGTNAVSEGQSVELWTPNDDTAQLFYIYPVNDTEFVFEIASKDGYVIAPSASAAGSNSKSSQLKVQKYTGGTHQKWILCNNNGKPTTPFVTYTAGSYKVNTGGTPIRYRTGPGVTNAEIGTIPDNTVLKVTQVNKNWGYTSYNGKNGWVLLDFTEYTVTIDSINIKTKPDKLSYFIGDKFDPLGMVITAKYSNGQVEEVSSGFTVSCDLTSAGIKTVTVTYKGKTDAFTVEVNDVAVDDISVHENNLKKEYYINDVIDTTGLNLLVRYNNGYECIIDSGFTTDYSFAYSGTTSVMVYYGGKSTSYEVSVLPRQSSNSAKLSITAPDAFYTDEETSVYVALQSSGVYDGNITIEYDPTKLNIVDAQAMGALASRNAEINKNYDTNKIRISFAGTSALSANGNILELKFAADSNASGATDISISDVNMYDKNGSKIDCNTTSQTIPIKRVVNSAEITNIQSRVENGRKIVTADVSSDDVMCYLAEYEDGALVECDKQQPSNGKVELSVTDNGKPVKFMAWNVLMKPLMNTREIY